MVQKLTNEQAAAVERTMQEALMHRDRFTFRIDRNVAEEMNSEKPQTESKLETAPAQMAARQILLANRKKTMFTGAAQPNKRGLLKANAAPRPLPVKKVANPKTLDSLRQEVVDNMEGKVKCDVCGKKLSLGDVYYTVNLAVYGCSTPTERVCGLCLDSVREGLR